MKALVGLLAGLLVAVPAWPAAADQTIRVEYTEVPYRQPHAFLALAFEGLGNTSLTHGTASADGKPIGFSLTMISARDSNLQFQFGLGAGSLNTSALKVAGADSLFEFELTLGGRLFPRKPLLAFGSVVIRPTLSASAGFNTVGSSANGVMILTGGFVFGLDDDPNGLMAEFVLRPLGGAGGFTPPGLADDDQIKYGTTWGFRFGFLFGP
jgi:hypothetical protein